MDDRTITLMTQQDIIANYTQKKQKAINKLSFLFRQGIPTIYTKLPKDELLLLLNICLYRALFGYYNKIKCENMEEYAGEAIRAFNSIVQSSFRLKEGARILRPTPIVKVGLQGKTLFIPYQMFMAYLDDDKLKELRSGLRPDFLLALDDVLLYADGDNDNDEPCCSGPAYLISSFKELLSSVKELGDRSMHKTMNELQTLLTNSKKEYQNERKD